ncbi:DUF445 domain-containing protein [Pseudoscourfieldia marina]
MTVAESTGVTSVVSVVPKAKDAGALLEMPKTDSASGDAASGAQPAAANNAWALPDRGPLEKGALVNEVACVIMVIGIALHKGAGVSAGFWIFYFGLFGFAGGITNWIAIKMLFDEIPGVYGSGIIPKQFKQIRTTIKRMVMETFFEPKFLEKQLRERLSKYANSDAAREAVSSLMSTPEFESALDEKLNQFGSGMTGTMLKMLGLDPMVMKPYVKPFVEGVAEDCAPFLAQMLAEGNLPVLQLRDEVDRLMEERLKELTAEKVKALVEDIMREHLGWLVVWGVIFGIVIGIICVVAGF